MRFVRNWEEFPTIDYAPKVKVRTVSGDKVQLSLVEYQPGASVSMHKHPDGEQIMYVLEGRMRLNVGGEEAEMSPGYVAVIPANIMHSTKALERTVFLEAVHPIRMNLLVGYIGLSDDEYESDKAQELRNVD